MSILQSGAIQAVLGGGLAEAHQPVTESEAALVLREHYGLSGTLKRLATEKDDTFYVQSSTGDFVLKIGNPAEPWAEIDFQVCLLQHIISRDPTLPIPQVIAAENGEVLLSFTDSFGQKRIARLMTYLAGKPLDSTHSTHEGRVQIGRLLARLRHATADFSHPADSRIMAWDVKNLPRLAPLLAVIDNERQHQQLVRGFERFAALHERVLGLRQQVLHNDFSQSNIVVNHDSAAFVTGLIDFGDAVRTAIAIDVSTALLNQLPRDAAQRPVDDLFAQGKDVLRGYLELAELSAEELELIPHLTMARVVTRALLSIARARQFPENRVYILRNTEPGWAQLDWFLARSVDEVSASLQTFLPKE